MEIKQLFYFAEIYRCRSFTQTAKNCFITPQGISISMNRLEEELGVKLFERLPHGVCATPEADFLYARAEKILQLLEECDEHFRQNRGGTQELHVMFVRGTVEQFARETINIFRQRYPNFTVTMHVGTDRECEAAVRNGDIQIGVCAGPVDTHDLAAKIVYSGKNVLLVHKDSPLYHKAAVSASDLAHVQLALQEKTTNSTNALLTMCRKAGVTPSCVFIDEPRAALIMAEMGMCCGLTNNISAQKLCTPDLRIMSFESPEMDWNVFCIYRKDRILTPQIRSFVSLLCKDKKGR